MTLREWERGHVLVYVPPVPLFWPIRIPLLVWLTHFALIYLNAVIAFPNTEKVSLTNDDGDNGWSFFQRDFSFYQFRLMLDWSSVTKFGQNLPLWHNVKNFGHFERVHLVFGNILGLLWQIIYAFGHFFSVVNAQILNKQPGNLVTLLTTDDWYKKPRRLPMAFLVHFGQIFGPLYIWQYLISVNYVHVHRKLLRLV